jgi:hypothetical protein
VERVLLPRPAQSAPPFPPLPAPELSLLIPSAFSTQIPQLPPGITFQDKRDHDYFCHFRDVTAAEFSSGFDPTLWSSLVLQACDNQCIRQLTSATAAMSIAVKTLPFAREQAADMHSTYALQQYVQAINGLNTQLNTLLLGEMAQDGEANRLALISALLIFCFEGLQGDLGRGLIYIQSAINMIITQVSTNLRPYYFPRLGPSLGFRANSPIEKELLTAFMRLDQPSVALMCRQRNGPPVPANRIFLTLFGQEQYEIPSKFENISEARIYLEDIKWRLLQDKPDFIPTPSWDSGAEEFPFANMESIPEQLKQWLQAADVINSSSYLSYRLAQWHDAFSQLLNDSMTPAGEGIFVPAAIMHVQALASELLMTGYFAPAFLHPRASSFSTPGSTPGSSSLSLPDTIMEGSRRRASSQRSSRAPTPEAMGLFPTVRAILLFSRRLIAHPKFRHGFVFDVGIIPSLCTIMLMCPDRTLRKEAIDVLRSMGGRREAMWDSKVCADAGERALAMEDMQSGLNMIDPTLLGAH